MNKAKKTKTRCRIPTFEVTPEEREAFLNICEENVTKSADVLRALVRAFINARKEYGVIPYPIQLRSAEETKRATSIGNISGKNVAFAEGDAKIEQS